MRLLEVYLQLCLVVHLAHAQQQLAFGLHTGQHLRHEQDAARVRVRERGRGLAPPDPSSLAASDLHDYALSLLDALSIHSTLATSAPNTPYLPAEYYPASSPSTSAVLAWLDRLYTGGGTRRALERTRRGERDWSVRGVVRALHHFATDQLPATIDSVLLRPRRANHLADSRASSSSRGRDPTFWRERLGTATLNEPETKLAMDEVVALLTRAGDKGSGPSWTLLGDLYLTGHLGPGVLGANATRAREWYTLASERAGDPDAQYQLGFLYATQYGTPAAAAQQGSALVHYTFAALSGHVPATMTVGYRHWAGIGAKQSCQAALPWYKSAAEAAIRTFNAGPPGGLHLSPPKLRLSDLAGGVYGPGSGAGAAAAGARPVVLSTGGSTAQTANEWHDLVEFHQFHADKGDSVYMFRLARLYYGGFGAGGLGGTRRRRSRLSHTTATADDDGLGDGGRDFVRASRWFGRLARKVWPGDGKDALIDPASLSSSSTTKSVKNAAAGKAGGGYYDAKLDKKNDKVDDQTVVVAGLAAGYLGRMYLRGEGVPANARKAFLWFKRGTTRGDRESHNALGVMYRDGLGGLERNLKVALLHFHAAAQQDLADAQVNLGKYHFGLGEYALATSFFEAAIRVDGNRQPDQFQAYYYLAELASLSASSSSGDHCPATVSFYKHVAERGDWDHEVWFEAERARERGDLARALLGYWIMAERGYEVAQNNVAWILDRDKSRIRVPWLDSPRRGSNETDRIALTYWTRSAAQDNVDALVKLGDYYFDGIGTTAGGGGEGGPQYDKAAALYQSAATSRLSAIAMWNLGWMHETGTGVAQDLHLAKRYLDQAVETSPNALFPATLSLVSLYARAAYHAVVDHPDDKLNAWSLFGRDHALGDGDEPHAAPGFVPQGGWGFGRAWRDIQRSWGIDPGREPEVVPARPAAGAAPAVDPEQRRGGGEPWEYAQEDAAVTKRGSRRVGEGDGDDDDDEFFVDEDEGDFGGTVAIVALCMLLAWLVYFRQRPRADGEHRAADQGRIPPREEERLV
ncbi:hypothetical protein JCM11491_001501 [Sporobolomyces phaffii]